MAATIHDIAREAGVSIATVSKVINNKAHVSPDTRKRVLQVMEQLRYTPTPPRPIWPGAPARTCCMRIGSTRACPMKTPICSISYAASAMS